MGLGLRDRVYSEPEAFAMEIAVRVSLIDLKRAFRRLLARLPDESEAGGDFVFFNADGNSLNIVAGETSETLNATVMRPGQARVPSIVVCGIARTLRFYRGRVIVISFSPEAVRIDRTDYRHPTISVLAPSGGQVVVVTKPAKLHNL
jgi:hypothetical protein